MKLLPDEAVREFFLLLRHSLYGEPLPAGYSGPSEDLKACIRGSGMEWLFSHPGCRMNGTSYSDDVAFRQQLYCAMTEKTLTAIFEKAAEKQIPMAVMKGAVLSACYPEGISRPTNDIDLYIPGAYKMAFKELMGEMKAKLGEALDENQLGVDCYVMPNEIYIEAHYAICSYLPDRQRNALKKEGMFGSEHFMPFQVNGKTVMTFEPEYHLAYMIYHFLKHLFFYEGGTLKMLADITLFVNANAGEIDEKVLERLLADMGYLKAADAIFGVCREMAGMKKDFFLSTRPVYAEKMLERIAVEQDNTQKFREHLAWSIYHVDLTEDEAGNTDTTVRFKWWIFLAFLPFSLDWSRWRGFWGIQTAVKREKTGRF